MTDIMTLRVFGGLELWCRGCNRILPYESYHESNLQLCKECRRADSRSRREKKGADDG